MSDADADADARVAVVASRQHALVTTAQAIRCGLTEAAIRHRLATGRWTRVHRGVYLIAGAPFTWETKVHAAILAAGPHALASHRTAGVLHDVDDFRPGPVEIVVPRHRRPVRLPVRVHESTDLELAQPVMRRGIPTTGLLRTLLDVGCLVRYDVLDAAVEQVVRETRYDWPDLYHCLVTHARRGRNGCGPFRAVLEERYGEELTDSRLETLVGRLLDDAGIEPWEQQHPIHDGDRFVCEVDLAWPRWKVAIECQSKKHHLVPTRFEKDLRRLTEARLLGWNVLEYTKKFYVEHPAKLVAEVRLALDQAKLRDLSSQSSDNSRNFGQERDTREIA